MLSPYLGPCWLWTASLNADGYGRFVGWGGYLAHRFSWTLVNGEIPEGKVTDHLCRVHACVNFAHIEIVTQGVNLHRGDSIQARNARKTHCVRGHEFTPENTRIDARGCRQCRTCKAQRRAVCARLGGAS